MKNTQRRLIALPLLAFCFWGGVLPVCAQKDAATQKGSVIANGQTRLVTKADQEIARRIEGLNALKIRMQSMKKISDSTKSDLSATIQNQVTALTDLKAKIDTESDLSALRADVQSITKSYRSYALVIPQGTVLSAADRVLTLADTIDALAAKLQRRIDTAQASGQDMSQASALLSDMKIGVSGARTGAQAAIDTVAVLTPDGGDKDKMQSNLAALQNARTQIKNAHGKLHDCRQDANDIIGILKELKTQK